MEKKEQEYTFVEERVISKWKRLGKLIIKLMTNILLPACICLGVCYIYLRESGRLENDGRVAETTPQHVMSVVDDEEETETESEASTEVISEEEELMQLEQAINKMVVVVSVARENTEESTEENIEKIAEDETEQNDMEVTKYTGAIVSASSSVYIILPYSNVEGGQEILTYFPDGSAVATTVYDIDYETGLALLKVESTKVTADMRDSILAVTVEGRQGVDKGAYVVYCGNVVGSEPMFIKGHVSNSGNQVICTDLNYDVVITDITLDGVQDGFIFNRTGKLVGIVGMNYENLQIPGMIAGAEALDLEYIINNMLNGKKDIYVGIRGQDITPEIEEIVGDDMPKGIYVNSVIVDSPAYNAGVMPGDIIVYIGVKSEPTMSYFRNYIEARSKGDEILIKVKRRIGNEYNEYSMNVLLGSRD